MEEVSKNEGDEDRKSESREATEVLETDEDDEKGSVGVGEEQGGSDGAVDKSVEGLGNFGTESDTKVVSEGDHDRKEEEGEVVNQAEKKVEEKSNEVMRKSQVPHWNKTLELSQGSAPTRRSSRIAGKFGQAGASKKGERKESAPLEISGDEQEDEEEVPLIRRSRSTPTDQVTPAKEKEILAVEEEKKPEAPKQEEELEGAEQLEKEDRESEAEPAEKATEEPAINDEEVETSQSGQEEDEDDEPPLKCRLRSSRAAYGDAKATEGPGEAPANAQTTANVLATSEEATAETEGKEKEEIDKAAYQRERKRKGKMPAKPAKKKVRRANTMVIIQEPIHVPFGQKDSEEEETGEPEESSSGELYTMSEEIPDSDDKVSLVDEAESLERITYEKILVELDDGLLAEMQKFEDPNLQTRFNQKDSKSKELKLGKMIHLPSLSEVSAKTILFAYIEQIGFEWMLNIDTTEVPINLAREFFTSFRFRITTDLDESSVSFRVFGMELVMSVTE